MTIFEEIGGENAVNAAIDLFYEKVLVDPILSPFFVNIDMTSQNRKQRSFFTLLFKGNTANAEDYMRQAHKTLVAEQGLSDVHFDAVAGHLQATLIELNVPEHLIEQIMKAAGGLKNAVLNR